MVGEGGRRLHVITNVSLRNYIERKAGEALSELPIVCLIYKMLEKLHARARPRAHTRAHMRAHIRVRARVFSQRVDSYSIHGVNLSKAFASARENEYHLNALSIPAYICVRA